MRINTNTAAMNTYSRLTQANGARGGSMAKLSSGLRINKAGDDAAGLSISEKMKNQISGLTQATRNAQDGISLIQTAEGALNETHSILNRMRDLTVQAANDTNTDDDRQAIQREIQSLSEEIDRIADTTTFNTKGLMSGKFDIEDAELSTLVNDYNGHLDKVVATDHLDTLDNIDSLSSEDKQTLIDIYNSKASVGNQVSDINEFKINFGEPDADPKFVEGDDYSTALNALEELDSSKEITKSDLRDLSKLDSTALESALGEGNATDKEGNAVTTREQLTTNGESKFAFQIGANSNEQMNVRIANMSAKGLGIDNIDVSAGNTNNFNTDKIIETIDSAISQVSTQRAELGATQNRLEHTVSNLSTTRENLSEANSRIRDVDMAEEMMEFTKNNILSQASTAMLAQANQMPQGVLQLLG